MLLGMSPISTSPSEIGLSAFQMWVDTSQSRL